MPCHERVKPAKKKKNFLFWGEGANLKINSTKHDVIKFFRFWIMLKIKTKRKNSSDIDTFSLG